MEHGSNKGKIKYTKRNSELTRTNKIKNELFSLAQKEINEKKKIINEPFSFSSLAVNVEKHKKTEKNLKLKNINIQDKQILNDSSCDSSKEDNSSDLSCDEEEI